MSTPEARSNGASSQEPTAADDVVNQDGRPPPSKLPSSKRPLQKPESPPSKHPQNSSLIPGLASTAALSVSNPLNDCPDSPESSTSTYVAAFSSSPILRSQAEYHSDDDNIDSFVYDPSSELDDLSLIRPPPPFAPFLSTTLPVDHSETPADTHAEPVDDKSPSSPAVESPSSPAVESPPKTCSPEEVEAAKYLSRIGYFVHLPLRVLVCTGCSSSVQLKNAYSHKVKTSSSCRLPTARSILRTELEKNLLIAGASDTLVLPSHHHPIPPIPGIPIVQGWVCTNDVKSACYGEPFASETSRKRHFQQKHSKVPSSDRSLHYRSSPVQSLYLFAGDRICVATAEKPLPPAVPRYEEFISSFEDGVPVPASNPSSLLTKPTVFETFTQWHVELAGTDLKQLYEHARRPDAQDPQLQRLRTGITSYFRNIVPDILKSGHHHLLCCIHSPEPLVLDHQPFCVPQNASTLASYSNIFSGFILMMAKCLSEPIPGYPMYTTENQNAAISQALRNLDDTTMTERQRLEQIHELCWLSLSEQPEDACKQERATPILRFLIAYHLAEDGHDHFLPPRYVSHTLSAIQWCWQAVGYCRCTLFAANYPEGAIGAYENIVKPYLQELEHSPFTTLRSVIHLIASLVHNASTLPRFLMAATRDHFSIDGHPITFKSFREYCVDLVSTAETRLATVLRGCPLDDADELITNALRVGQTSNIFYDRLRDVGAGYSFMSDTNNPLAAGKSRLIQHFLRDGCHEFSVPTPSCAHSEAFRPLECAIWLSDVDRLVEALYAATVATWPGAGRGTELDHLTYNNQHGRRHLFLINNILTFVTSYSKTQKMTGKALLIPRGIDPRLARVFIITLNYVYYAAQVITHQLGDDCSSSAYSKYIFVRRGTPLNTDAMTQILRSFTNDHFRCQFGVRDWRHLMKFVLRHMADISLDQDDDDAQDADRAPINSLFGHGQRIADTVYGIEADSLTDLTQPDVARAHRYGIVYQKALGLWADFSVDSLGLPNDEKSTPSNQTSLVVAPLDAASRLHIARDLEDVLDTRLPAFGDLISSTLSRVLYHHIPNLSTSLPLSCRPPPPSTSTRHG
ncbi:hypothetical protein PTI98_009259 [Pleurotus ostreatus]|nr:hypothetical protein PTI98_009259 [Pleurotus ostreatus]